jgi:TPR repeat protein
VSKDYAEAVKWYRKAAEQNHSGAQSNLGVCYATGQGVLKDYAEAVKWYRKAAEQNHSGAQYNLGVSYANGQGVPKDYAEAVKWYRKAAEQNDSDAQRSLGDCYYFGQGVQKDYVEAVKWFHKAAEENDAEAQFTLGVCYQDGKGVPKNYVEAVKWYRKAAEQNHLKAQHNLALCYARGEGVPKGYVEAYKWLLLAAAQGDERSTKKIPLLESLMSREQIAEGQKLARDFRPHEMAASAVDGSSAGALEARPKGTGTGFFITEDGYLITNEHVAGGGAQVRLVTASGLISAKVVKVDAANDLALLKAEGKFVALPVAASRAVKLGSTAVTVGFPNIGLQGFAPKFARGEIASLSGPQDDARFFQISVPLQPGNSGGALVDERGNVIGIVSAKLSASATLKATGELPENVNYAVKSSFLLGFLESVPEVAAKLKEPNTSDLKFAEVVEKAKGAAVLVLIY